MPLTMGQFASLLDALTTARDADRQGAEEITSRHINALRRMVNAADEIPAAERSRRVGYDEAYRAARQAIAILEHLHGQNAS